MIIDTFASSTNLLERRALSARPKRRAFFMPFGQLIDLKHKICSVARVYQTQPQLPFLISSFDGFVLYGDGGNRFFCFQLKYKSIMVIITPKGQRIVDITEAQLEFLDIFFNDRDADNMARHLRSVCIDALGNPDSNRNDVAYILHLAHAVQDLHPNP